MTGAFVLVLFVTFMLGFTFGAVKKNKFAFIYFAAITGLSAFFYDAINGLTHGGIGASIEVIMFFAGPLAASIIGFFAGKFLSSAG